jgi:hypothetical protein
MSDITTGYTLATPENMRAVREANPDRKVGDCTILGRRAFAVSVNYSEERTSADAGDYFMQPDDEPLRDSDGEPMVLAFERSYLVDALSDELL